MSGPSPDPTIQSEACAEFKLIGWYGGDRKATLQSIYNALNFMGDETEKARLDWLRGVLGDTSQTIAQIKDHNAVWHSLCDPKSSVTRSSSEVSNAHNR